MLDPSRVVAYVITGIGFLGAGTIIKHGINIKGLTTAASLWVVAAVGVSVGAGDYGLGVVATAIVLLSLWPVRMLANAVGIRASRTHRLELELEPQGSIAAVLSRLEAAGRARRFRQGHRGGRPPPSRARRARQTDRDLGRLVEAAASTPEVRTATIAP